jgi:solute carrier family 25 uncoupling protein 8/9
MEGKKPPELRRYHGLNDAYSKIYKQEGLKGFWTGLAPNIVRNSVINAAELAGFY